MILEGGAARILSSFLEARTGQALAPARHWRVEATLRPILRARNLPDFDALVAKLVSGEDPRLGEEVVDALLNNETSFFRDPLAFQALQDALVDMLRARGPGGRRLKAWSAGCSAGQEAYSLAMMGDELAAALPGTQIEVTGTDVSAAALERAREGLYSQFEIQRGLPIRKALQWFAQEEKGWRVQPRLARGVRFRRASLLDDPPPLGGPFDVILCRNVLLYLSPERRGRALETLAGALRPGGLLMMGAGETVLGQTSRFTPDPEVRGIYRLAPAEQRRRA